MKKIQDPQTALFGSILNLAASAIVHGLGIGLLVTGAYFNSPVGILGAGLSVIGFVCIGCSVHDLIHGR